MVQFFPFLCCDLSVFAFSDPVQSQIHDPDPFQLLYLISQIPAHSADLPVQSLCQNNGKCIFPGLFYCTGSGHRIQILFFVSDVYSPSHLLNEFRSNFFVYSDLIFFLVCISCAHHAVDQISIICHDQKPFRIFIQSSRIGHA